MDIFYNVIGGLITTGLIAVTTWFTVQWQRRQPFQRFFGIHDLDQKKIIIYLSNLNIIPGEAHGPDKIGRAFSGQAVSLEEFKVAMEFQKHFRYRLPAFIDKPRISNKLRLSNTQLEILPAPQNIEELEHTGTIIALGSSAFNTASQYIEEAEGTHTYFEDDYRRIIVSGNPPYEDIVYGFIERLVYDSEQKRALFYVAGLDEYGTASAAHYLIDHWKELHKSYKNNVGFTIMLKVDRHNYKKVDVVLSRPNKQRRALPGTPTTKKQARTQSKESNTVVVTSASKHSVIEDTERKLTETIEDTLHLDTGPLPSGTIPQAKLDSAKLEHTKGSTPGSATVWPQPDDDKTSNPNQDENTS